MSTRDRARNLLIRTPDRRPIGRVTDELPELEALGGAATRSPDSAPFSVFIPEHEQMGIHVAAEMMDLANREGLDAALDRVERAAEEVSLELAQYALMVFITHHPQGQRLPLPSLEERIPEDVRPSGEPRPSGRLEALGGMGDEAALDWFREDAAANAHHERWHVVYPFAGIPNPDDPFGPPMLKDRQGELFMYMHEQMLARYDAERLCAGLDAVEPLFDFMAPLAQGYAPEIPRFDRREPDSLMSDSTQFDPTTLATWDGRLFGDVLRSDATLRRRDGSGVVATPDLIGSTVEADIGSTDASHYGSLHNMGHVTIAFIPDPNNPGFQRGGVMQSTSVAIRDPIFWRWHRHVDDLLFGWQELQPEQSFDDAPDVLLRNRLEEDGQGEGAGDGDPVEPDGASPDLALVLDETIDGDAATFGEQHFGGDRWSVDPTDTGVATDELVTTMRRRDLGDFTMSYLDHPDYHYFLRVENRSDEERTVTVRLFLAPEAWVEERRHWIELDKFQHTLAPGRNVIPRSSKLSSVARKPASRPGDPPPPPEEGFDPNYCDCGWPYHLLLPRGSEDGVGFRLLAVLTDWDLDRVEVEGKCGSMSFCGKRDKAYPDRRPMGYPFDRRWPGDELAPTIRDLPNMAACDLVLRNEVDPV